MKRKFFLGLLINTLVISLIALPSGKASAVNRVVGSNGADCVRILQSDIPAITKLCGGRVEVLSTDIKQPGNEQVYRSLKDRFGLQGKTLPLVIVGNTVLARRDEMRRGVLPAIEQARTSGGTDILFGGTSSDNADYLTILLISGCIFLLVAIALGIGWLRTNNRLKELRKKKSVVDKENADFRQRINELEQSQDELTNKVIELERRLISDPTLGALLGLANSPVDYLAEAIRIIYYNDKRPADVTVRDVNGYLISLLKMLTAFTGVEIIGYYQKTVEFNSRYHVSKEPVQDRELVRIVEVGWKKQDVVMKKAVVEKMPARVATDEESQRG